MNVVDLFFGIVFLLLGSFLAVWGIVPFWPGLSGDVPFFVYPLSVLFSVFGVGGAVAGVCVIRQAVA